MLEGEDGMRVVFAAALAAGLAGAAAAHVGIH
jgi:hypothetical protein